MFYLFFSYNRHPTAERHSQCSHIRSAVGYKNHNKWASKLYHYRNAGTAEINCKFRRLIADHGSKERGAWSWRTLNPEL